MTKAERADDAAVAKALEQVRAELPKSVVKLRHELVSDWSGDPAIYVFVTVRDGFADERNFAKESDEIDSLIKTAIREAEVERYPYTWFSSVSEERSEHKRQREGRSETKPRRVSRRA